MMKFKEGDRVHVTRLNGEKVDFYATLKETKTVGVFCLIDCTYHRYETVQVYTPKAKFFGPDKTDYYTLATVEDKHLRWSDGSSAEGEIYRDEEDTEPVEVQHIKRENKIELDNHYIIEVKKGLYVRNATSNYFFKFTKDINEADVYEYENAAIRHAEFVDGRVLNLKRYVEVE